MTPRRRTAVALNENETPNTIEDFEAMAEQTNSPIEITAKTIISPPKRQETNNDFEVEETDRRFNHSFSFSDPLSHFLDTWADETETLYIRVIRLRDPIGKKFRNPHLDFTAMPLGETYFTPKLSELISEIQTLNDNSGGKFRLLILDSNGRILATNDNSHIVETVIPDPKQEERTEAKSDDSKVIQLLERTLDKLNERKEVDTMGEMKKTLEMFALMKSALGVNETGKANSLAEAIAHLPQEQQIQMLTAMNPTTQTLQTQIAVQQANVLSDFISTLAENARNSSSPNEPSNFDKVLETIKSSPQLMNTVAVLGENLIKMAAFALTPKENRQFGQGQPIQQQPVIIEQPVQVQNPQVIDAEPVIEQPQVVQVPAIEKGDYNVMMDAIIEVLQSDDPITLQHEILVGLKEDYPLKFPMIKMMVKNTPFEGLKNFLKGYLSEEDLHLLENEKIVARLQELHNLIINES